MNDTVNQIQAYLKSVKLEWAKITWPERKQVIAETFAGVIPPMVQYKGEQNG